MLVRLDIVIIGPVGGPVGGPVDGRVGGPVGGPVGGREDVDAMQISRFNSSRYMIHVAADEEKQRTRESQLVPIRKISGNN